MAKYKIKNQKIQAFSLIELGIAIAIISVLSGIIINTGTKQIESTKLKQTYQKMQLIKETIESFVLINNRLPCPADASLNINNTNAGIEDCAGNISSTVTSLPAVTPAINDDQIIGGSVPFSTLMLPKDIALDGWGNKFSFIVTRGLTDSDNGFDNETSGIIKVQNFFGNLINDQVAYLLIFHGSSGKGSWLASGTRIEVGSNNRKNENSHTPASANSAMNEVFINNVSYTFYDGRSDLEFDDILVFQTKSNIATNLSYYLHGEICYNMQRAIKSNDQTANFLCNGTGGVPDGSPSHPFCNEYLLNLAYEIKKKCVPRIN